MSFQLTSRSRLIAQLNQDRGRNFGPGDFTFGKPRIDEDGLTHVTITPVSEETNQGQPIELVYERRVIRNSSQVNPTDNEAVGELVTSLAIAVRCDIEPGSFWKVERDGKTVLIIDDYVIDGEITLGVKDESL